MNEIKDIVSLDIPKEDLEEVVDLFLNVISESALSNDVYILLTSFCSKHRPMTDEEFIGRTVGDVNDLLK